MDSRLPAGARAEIGILLIKNRLFSIWRRDFWREAIRAPSTKAEQIAQLQSENTELKSDLKEVSELNLKKQSLEREVGNQKSIDADWVNAQSNRIQHAMEQNKQELKEIGDWHRNRQEAEKREEALARLQVKGLPPNQSPEETAKAYEELQVTLRQIGLAMKSQIELREQWTKSSKTEQARALFQSQFGESQRLWESALSELGQDRVLYDVMYAAIPLKNPPSRTPVLRSILPDLRGVSVTVYLDGSVVFSR